MASNRLGASDASAAGRKAAASRHSPLATRHSLTWVAVGLICLTCLASCRPTSRDADADDLALPVGDFTLTERGGRDFHASDLAGKVWVASFIFTQCGGPCPQVTGTMARLQSDFASEPDFRLVTFTVDPEHDTPEVLKQYAATYGAKTDRWFFVTGKEADVYKVLGERFHIGAEKNTGRTRTWLGNAVTHDTHLAVVDRKGRIRDYFTGKRDADDEHADED